MRERRRVYRCSQGHLFTHRFWPPIGAYAFTMIRFGFGAYTRCPVEHHWGLVRLVKETDLAHLTEEERQNLKIRERLDDQDAVRLNSSIWLLMGLITLVVAIVVQSWWGALLAVVWVLLWGAVFIGASRRSKPADASE